MRAFDRLPIAKKLTVMVMVPTLAALLATCTLFFVFDMAQARQALATTMSQSADFAGDRLASPLRNKAEGQAQDVMHMLRQNPEILAAQLYDYQGRPFARYFRDRESLELPAQAPAPGMVFSMTRLEMTRPLGVLQNAPMGTLYILADASTLLRHTAIYSIAVILILIFGGMISFLLSRRLQNAIAQPILNLATLAKMVSEEKDYAIRGHKETDDEIGMLIDEFNGMLAQIQARDSALKEARDQLEARVRKRTSELQHEIELHKKTEAELEAQVLERERAEKEAQLARQAAENASRSKGEFLANMSHEIRTPMNGIIGMTDLLMGTPLNPGQLKYSDAIRRSGRALLKIIGDILDFSKVEAGLLEIEPIAFDLQVACEDVVEMLSPRAEEKGITLILRFAPGTPRRVVGDAGRIRQVLTNLISNAVKFTHEGHVLVNVERSSMSTDRASIRFIVEDTGIGTPPEKIDRIFGKYQQADASVSQVYGGTGLGLAISKQLVELMGGRIGVESKPNVGSRFFFTLVLPVDVEAATPKKHRDDLAGVRVLIAESNTPNQRVMLEQLSNWGMRAVAAGENSNVLKLLRDAVAEGDPFNIVMIDDHMPGVGGESLGRAIKADETLADALLVLLTSMGQRGDAQRMLELGFAAYLTRPVRQSELLDVLATLWTARLKGEPVGLVTRYTVTEGREGALQGGEAPRLQLHARVLVAEDNFVNQQVALELLKSFGCTVTMANDGVEALKCMREGEYDVVFMDCQMPRMDGYATTGEIRALEGNRKHTPIIAMTAHAMRGDRERCLASGMDDYVSKPIDPEMVIRVLRRWLPEQQAAIPEPGMPQRPGVEEPDDAPVLDLKQALFITGGKVAMFRRIATVYLQHMPNRIHELEMAILHADSVEIHRIAHSIQGASASVGGRQLREIAFRLEQRAQTCETEEALQWFGRIRDSFGSLKIALETAIHQDDSELPTGSAEEAVDVGAA